MATATVTVRVELSTEERDHIRATAEELLAAGSSPADVLEWARAELGKAIVIST